jgi:hypothetical protein
MILSASDVLPREHRLFFCTDPRLVEELAAQHRSHRSGSPLTDSLAAADPHPLRRRKAARQAESHS